MGTEEYRISQREGNQLHITPVVQFCSRKWNENASAKKQQFEIHIFQRNVEKELILWKMKQQQVQK